MANCSKCDIESSCDNQTAGRCLYEEIKDGIITLRQERTQVSSSQLVELNGDWGPVLILDSESPKFPSL
jgi:hypothetical protein